MNSTVRTANKPEEEEMPLRKRLPPVYRPDAAGTLPYHAAPTPTIPH